MQTKIALLREMGAERPYGTSRPLAIVDAELDEPGFGELVVKMAAAGLCHSDLSVINGDRPRDTPIALGHEASGVVERIGPGVTRFAPGDHVVMVFVPSCGHCVPCSSGRPALCEPGAAASGKGSLLNGGRRITCDSVTVNHHLGVSAFSTRAVVSENSCIRIDKKVPLDKAALLGCAVLTGVGAVLNSGELKPGQSCAIVGLGGVGLAALLGAHAAGARQIVAIDRLDDKLERAYSLGATHAFNAADPDLVAQVKAATNGGVEYAIEAASSVDALEMAYRITRRGGTTVTCSLPHPDHRFALQAVNLVAEERTIKGSYLGSAVPARDIPHYIALYHAGKLPVDKLITSRLSLDEINAGFDRLAAGEAVRQVIVF